MGQLIDLDGSGGARGYVAIPESGRGPGVLVLQEWWGLNPQIKGVADMMAAQGFVAMAPDLYRGELAGHDEMDKAGHLMTTLAPQRAVGDMSAAVDYLATHESTTGSGIGAIGFCMGGLMTFMVAAARGDVVKAAVPFYGYPAGGEPDWDGLTAVVRGHFAENDDHFPAEGARDMERRLQAMGKDIEISFHDAAHAFMNEEDPFGIYDQGLAGELWPQVIDFLHAQLG